MVYRLNHHWLVSLGPGKCLFGRFLLRISRIKRPQVMSMVKLDAKALNFGYEARALRALGLLLADGTPTVGGGKTF